MRRRWARWLAGVGYLSTDLDDFAGPSTNVVMRHLPTIDVGPGRWFLPMAERTALFLTDLLVGEDRAGLAPTTAAALATDPALAVWSAFTAWQRGSARSTMTSLADWLVQHATTVLQWSADAVDLPPSPAESVRQYIELAAESFGIGWLAAQLVSPASDALRESAQLAGLLWNAKAWFAQSDSNCPRTAPKELAGWPSAFPAEATAAASLAAEILVGRGDARGIAVDEIRAHAEQTAQEWAAPVDGIGARLPRLAVRVARLDQLERHFQQTLEHEKLGSLAEFAAGAGHEINNPLATIVGRAQLLLRDESDPERQREAAVIIAQAKRAHEMIADLRLFARPPGLEPQAFDLVELLESALTESTATAEEKSIQVTLVRPPGPVTVVLDPVQIRVALVALIRNAVEAIGREGRVEVAFESGDAAVVVRVTDTGPGIEPEHRRHIFDPFFSARQAGRGLGMGLSKCWRIVTLHQGQIEVESRPGRTTFTVRLPNRIALAGGRDS